MWPAAEAALRALKAVLERLAGLQPLLATGTVRVTSARPGLTDQDRAAVLARFGLSPDLQVLTDLVEAGHLDAGPNVASRRSFLEHVSELYRLCGVPAPPFQRSVEEAQTNLARLAAALIEISWQLAVCSRDPSCDVFIGNGIERALLDELVKEPHIAGVSAEREGRSRHMTRLAGGPLPLLDPTRLSPADAIAIRRDDSFEQWRRTLNEALDGYEATLAARGNEAAARGAFTETMAQASVLLRNRREARPSPNASPTKSFRRPSRPSARR